MNQSGAKQAAGRAYRCERRSARVFEIPRERERARDAGFYSDSFIDDHYLETSRWPAVCFSNERPSRPSRAASRRDRTGLDRLLHHRSKRFPMALRSPIVRDFRAWPSVHVTVKKGEHGRRCVASNSTSAGSREQVPSRPRPAAFLTRASRTIDQRLFGVRRERERGRDPPVPEVWRSRGEAEKKKEREGK